MLGAVVAVKHTFNHHGRQPLVLENKSGINTVVCFIYLRLTDSISFGFITLFCRERGAQDTHEVTLKGAKAISSWCNRT